MHVTTCKIIVMHSKTKKVSHDVAFGQPSKAVKHLKPFGCRMMYHPVVDKLPTFAKRLREGLCLGPEGGGIYLVLTDNGTVRTKHVRAYEGQFPGLSLFNTFCFASR